MSSRTQRRREIAKTRRAARKAQAAAARNETVKAERAARRRGRTPADDGSTAALELIQVARSGATTEELGEHVLDVMRRLLDAHPGDSATACAWLIGQLATQAAHACDQWDAAVDDSPAARWLAALAEDLAVQRAALKGLADGS